MSENPELLYLHRGSFRALEGTTAERVRANAWQVYVPRTAAVKKVVGKELTAELFDDSTWLIDDVESLQAMGSGQTADRVTVTVLLP